MQILRHTPPDRLADCYEAIHGHRIENARVLAHASVYEKMFTSALELIDGEESEVRTINNTVSDVRMRAMMKEILMNQLQLLQEESKKVAKTEDHLESPRSLNLISDAMVNVVSAINDFPHN